MKRIISVVVVLSILFTSTIAFAAKDNDSDERDPLVIIELTELGKTLDDDVLLSNIAGIDIMRRDFNKDGTLKNEKLKSVKANMKNQSKMKSNDNMLTDSSSSTTYAVIPGGGSYPSALLFEFTDIYRFEQVRRQLYLSEPRAETLTYAYSSAVEDHLSSAMGFFTTATRAFIMTHLVSAVANVILS